MKRKIISVLAALSLLVTFIPLRISVYAAEEYSLTWNNYENNQAFTEWKFNTDTYYNWLPHNISNGDYVVKGGLMGKAADDKALSVLNNAATNEDFGKLLRINWNSKDYQPELGGEEGSVSRFSFEFAREDDSPLRVAAQYTSGDNTNNEFYGTDILNVRKSGALEILGTDISNVSIDSERWYNAEFVIAAFGGYYKAEAYINGTKVFSNDKMLLEASGKTIKYMTQLVFTDSRGQQPWESGRGFYVGDLKNAGKIGEYSPEEVKFSINGTEYNGLSEVKLESDITVSDFIAEQSGMDVSVVNSDGTETEPDSGIIGKILKFKSGNSTVYIPVKDDSFNHTYKAVNANLENISAGTLITDINNGLVLADGLTVKPRDLADGITYEIIENGFGKAEGKSLAVLGDDKAKRANFFLGNEYTPCFAAGKGTSVHMSFEMVRKENTPIRFVPYYSSDLENWTNSVSGTDILAVSPQGQTELFGQKAEGVTIEENLWYKYDIIITSEGSNTSNVKLYINNSLVKELAGVSRTSDDSAAKRLTMLTVIDGMAVSPWTKGNGYYLDSFVFENIGKDETVTIPETGNYKINGLAYNAAAPVYIENDITVQKLKSMISEAEVRIIDANGQDVSDNSYAVGNYVLINEMFFVRIMPVKTYLDINRNFASAIPNQARMAITDNTDADGKSENDPCAEIHGADDETNTDIFFQYDLSSMTKKMPISFEISVMQDSGVDYIFFAKEQHGGLGSWIKSSELQKGWNKLLMVYYPQEGITKTYINNKLYQKRSVSSASLIRFIIGKSTDIANLSDVHLYADDIKITEGFTDYSTILGSDSYTVEDDMINGFEGLTVKEVIDGAVTQEGTSIKMYDNGNEISDTSIAAKAGMVLRVISETKSDDYVLTYPSVYISPISYKVNGYATEGRFTKGSISAQVRIRMYKGNMNAMLIAVQYSNGKLIGCSAQNQNIIYDSKLRTELNVSDDSVDSVKMFLFDDSLAPLCDETELKPVDNTSIQSVEKLYPGYTTKALTLSYDDGVKQDEKLVEILNDAGIKATFNLCGVNHQTDEEKERIKTLYAGHEISNHSYSHPRMYLTSSETISGTVYNPMSLDECKADISKGKTSLEDIFGTEVNGFAWPYRVPSGRSDYNEMLEYLSNSGIAYARSSVGNGSFELPENWLEWNTTIHHSDLSPSLMEYTNKFLNMENSGTLKLFSVWGHSYEFDYAGSDSLNWNLIKNFAAVIKEHDDIWKATNIDIYNYVTALELLEIGETTVYNPTGVDLYVRINGINTEIPAGEEISL